MIELDVLTGITPATLALIAKLEPHFVRPPRPKYSVGLGLVIVEAMIELTPELAEYLLTEHQAPNNRGVKEGPLDDIKTTIEDGRFNPDQPDSTILFDLLAKLQNGTHRLTGVKQTGASIQCRIEFNHPVNIIHHLDQHKVRTVRDQAIILGRNKTEKDDYAPTKMLYRIINEITYFPGDTNALFRQRSEYGDELFSMVPVKIHGKQLSYPLRAALLWFAMHWPNELKEFVDRMINERFEGVEGRGPKLLNSYFLHPQTSYRKDCATYQGKVDMVLRAACAFDIFLNKRNLEELRAYFNGIRSLKKRVDPKWEPAFGSMFHPQTRKKSKGIPDEPEEG